MILDSLDGIGGPPLTDEQRLAFRRMVTSLRALVEETNCRIHLPHYRHTCLNPTTCTLEHDTYPHS